MIPPSGSPPLDRPYPEDVPPFARFWSWDHVVGEWVTYQEHLRRAHVRAGIAPPSPGTLINVTNTGNFHHG